MTIDTSVVTNAVLARLRAGWPDIGDGRAPSATSEAYAVLDLIGGGQVDGDMDEPERNQAVVYRVSSVSRDKLGATSVDGAREQAEFIAFRLRTTILDRAVPIVGTGWIVTGRALVASHGAVRSGVVVEVADDISLLVVTT